MNEKKTVWLGRAAIVVSFVIALVISLFLKHLGQGFEYVLEYAGLISPGILCIFLLRMFWKRTTTNGAPDALTVNRQWFKMTRSFRLGAVVVCTLPALMCIIVW